METNVYNTRIWGLICKLKKWIDIKFKNHPELIRLGLSTWSGNERMMKLALSLGLKKEAEYRNARIVDGNYYDSMSYGILKEEWLKLFE